MEIVQQRVDDSRDAIRDVATTALFLHATTPFDVPGNPAAWTRVLWNDIDTHNGFTLAVGSPGVYTVDRPGLYLCIIDVSFDQIGHTSGGTNLPFTWQSPLGDFAGSTVLVSGSANGQRLNQAGMARMPVNEPIGLELRWAGNQPVGVVKVSLWVQLMVPD